MSMVAGTARPVQSGSGPGHVTSIPPPTVTVVVAKSVEAFGKSQLIVTLSPIRLGAAAAGNASASAEAVRIARSVDRMNVLPAGTIDHSRSLRASAIES